MGKIDHGKDVLKIFKMTTGMSRRIAELEVEVARLKGHLDLRGETLKPSTVKILTAETITKGFISPKEARDGHAEGIKILEERQTQAVAPKPGTKPGSVRVRYKTTNKYFGVHLIKKMGKFNARVDRKGFRKNLGTFAVAEEAALAVQEFLGNKAECRRLRKLIATGKSEAESLAAGARHEKDAADGIEEIKGRYSWQWNCVGCSETYGGAEPVRCPKCGGSSFEKIKVLTEPEVELDRPQGRHNPPAVPAVSIVERSEVEREREKAV